MKKKQIERLSLSLLIALSLFSALYVNVNAHSSYAASPQSAAMVKEATAREKESGREFSPPVRHLALIRLLEVVLHWLNNAPKQY